jgi:hypothetical protein
MTAGEYEEAFLDNGVLDTDLIANALDVLLALHERTDDGALRDEISHVRHALHEWLDEVTE